MPNLPSFDKTPVKDPPAQELPQRTPTPEGHDQITVVRAVVKKQNLTISHGQRSVKKALNQASRKSAVQAQNRILTKKRMISKAQPRLKISSSLKIKAKKHLAVSTGSKSCLFFSCSWCQFRVSDREHFQRHISLHNFFPQGCRQACICLFFDILLIYLCKIHSNCSFCFFVFLCIT
ncbi:unnamed protein product [Acanthosepion pharaonis]|uniref:C2H2-type domain-containing protein n=1 Tax=Acanthosepion pharaonis TaxID=158019 RepID=A0A812CR28_ACAPH|nr:unnamed protein product [Sepia pharaonis]